MKNVPVWFLLVFTFHPFLSRADDSDTSQARRQFLMVGMRAEREKLRSGQVVITGDHWRTSPELGEQRLPARFDVWFDLDAQKFRFTQRDFEQHPSQGMDPRKLERLLKHTSYPRGSTSQGVEWVTTDCGGTLVRTPDYDLHQPMDHPHVSRMAPGTVTGTVIRVWDFQTMGLEDWNSFEGNDGLDHVLAAYGESLQFHSLGIDQSGITNLKVRSEWNPHANSTEYELWIDEIHQMTPIRVLRHDLNDSLKVVSQCDVSWKELAGAMVPTTFKISNIHNPPEYTEGYDLVLDWSHVNEPIDSKVFTAEGIAQPGALVADMRLGQIVVERVHPTPLPVAAATPKPVQPKPPSRLGWIVLGHLIAGGLFAVWFYRRKARLAREQSA